MPRRKEIKNLANSELFSVQIYDEYQAADSFTEDAIFEKWAAVEVNDIDNVPEGMESHSLSGGKYAVFIHKGTWSAFYQTSQYIFGTWLPESEFELDDREHFEIMGEKYFGPDDPNSEEEVWVPIRWDMKKLFKILGYGFAGVVVILILVYLFFYIKWHLSTSANM